VHLTYREWWTLVHGFVFGGTFLLSFAGVLVLLYTLSSVELTDAGIALHLRWLRLGTWAMALAAWGTVLIGTWIVYPWYRAPGGGSPRAGLLSSSATSEWDTFGMEWKQHVAWLAPFLATTVALLVGYYGSELARRRDLRMLVTALFVLGFASASASALFGALITKIAPVL
jgi:hypothetical protein